MLLITGAFRILGAAPDGDSVRFYPTDPGQWDLVEGQHKVRRNTSGGAQLRLDGIDALETHYGAAGGNTHQPLELGRATAANVVSWLGFSGVRRGERETVTDASPAEVPGYLFTRGADLYGRCVALAGRGDPPAGQASGQRVHVSVPMLRRTIHYRQLAAGLAYPTYYRKLYLQLREAMSAAVAKARTTAPLWAADRTTNGASLPDGLTNLENGVLLMPKLFRRLVDYYSFGRRRPVTRGVRRLPGSTRRPHHGATYRTVDRP
jgi:hypothetical protein